MGRSSRAAPSSRAAAVSSSTASSPTQTKPRGRTGYQPPAQRFVEYGSAARTTRDPSARVPSGFPFGDGRSSTGTPCRTAVSLGPSAGGTGTSGTTSSSASADKSGVVPLHPTGPLQPATERPSRRWASDRESDG